MNYIQAMFLGLVQGITEFLPISSSGHLFIVNKFFGLQSNTTFSVILHTASLLAIIIYFRNKIVSLIKEDFLKVGFCLFLGIFPAAIAGLLFEDIIDRRINSLSLVGLFLIINSLILFFGEKFQKPQGKNNYLKSLLIGLAQIVALFPGISRSGTTISAGVSLGINRRETIEFSFLMAIPLILGATILKLDNMISEQLFNSYTLVGFLASFISSLVAIEIIIARLKSFKYFGLYTLVVGIILLIIQH